MRNRANQDLHEYAKKNNVCMWEIADKYGITNSTLCVKMRKEFSQEQKEVFMRIVDEINAE